MQPTHDPLPGLDNPQLIFLLGALLDAIAQTGPLPKQRITKVLRAKAAHTTPTLQMCMLKLIKVISDE